MTTVKGYVTVTECAAKHEVTRQAVLDAITGGRLAAEKVGPIYLIREEDCAAYRPLSRSERAAKAGRASKRRPRKPE